MMYLSPVLILFVFLLFYVAKRYFDSKQANEQAAKAALGSIIDRLRKLDTAIEDTNNHMRDRLNVFQKALENSITQFAEIVAATKKSEIDTQIASAAKFMRGGRRNMPTP